MSSRVAVTTGAPASTAAFAPTLPSHQAGDRLVLVVTGKYDTTTPPTINQGWQQIRNYSGGGTGSGNDTGPSFVVAYAKDAASGSETAPTVTPGATAPNSWEWICVSHRPGAGKMWRDSIGTLPGWQEAVADTTAASPLTGTLPAWSNQPTDGDAIFVVGTVPTDLGSALGTTTLTCTGLSGGTKTTATNQYVENGLGNDTAAVWAGWTGFTGTATAGLAVSMAVTGATNQFGLIIGFAFREQDDPNPIKLHYDKTDTAGESANDVSSSFTPQANAKVYVGVWSEAGSPNGGFSTPVDSLGELTFSPMFTPLGPTGSFNARFAVWESSDTGSTPGARTITVAVASGTAMFAWSVWSVKEQSLLQDSTPPAIGTGTTHSTGSLAAAATSGNIVAIFAGHNRDTGTVIPTPSGWTRLSQAAGGVGIYQYTGLFYRTDFTGTSATVDTSSDSGNNAAAVIMEWSAATIPPETGTFEGWGLEI